MICLEYGLADATNSNFGVTPYLVMWCLVWSCDTWTGSSNVVPSLVRPQATYRATK